MLASERRAGAAATSWIGAVSASRARPQPRPPCRHRPARHRRTHASSTAPERQRVPSLMGLGGWTGDFAMAGGVSAVMPARARPTEPVSRMLLPHICQTLHFEMMMRVPSLG